LNCAKAVSNDSYRNLVVDVAGGEFYLLSTFDALRKSSPGKGLRLRICILSALPPMQRTRGSGVPVPAERR